MSKKTFGKLVKSHRIKLNLTQRELGRKLNVGESTVRMWELEKNYPTFPVLIQLLNVLDIPGEKIKGCEMDG